MIWETMDHRLQRIRLILGCSVQQASETQYAMDGARPILLSKADLYGVGDVRDWRWMQEPMTTYGTCWKAL